MNEGKTPKEYCPLNEFNSCIYEECAFWINGQGCAIPLLAIAFSTPRYCVPANSVKEGR
jgi:hypothetical protein